MRKSHPLCVRVAFYFPNFYGRKVRSYPYTNTSQVAAIVVPTLTYIVDGLEIAVAAFVAAEVVTYGPPVLLVKAAVVNTVEPVAPVPVYTPTVAVAIVVVAPLEFKPLVMSTLTGTNLLTFKIDIAVSPAADKFTD